MESLKFTVIKTKEQYNSYCNILDDLISNDEIKFQDEIELLTLLIEKWDSENNSFQDSDPIEILKAIMDENELKAKDLVSILGLTKGTISKILNCQKGLSKDTIRKLSDHFKISQEAFNRPYRLKNEINRRYRNASLMNTRKNITEMS